MVERVGWAEVARVFGCAFACLAPTALLAVWLLSVLCGGCATEKNAVADPELTVYVTPQGECYHLAGCMALNARARPVKLGEVITTRRPCSICNPPSDPKLTPQRPFRRQRIERIPRPPRVRVMPQPE